MTTIGDTPTIRDRLNVALIEWQFVRISNEELREVLNEFLDENAKPSQIRILSDPELSDEKFAEIAIQLFRQRLGHPPPKKENPLAELPPVPEPTAVEPIITPPGRGATVQDEPKELYTGFIDWVALFHTVDDFLLGITRGWLSVLRLIGLGIFVSLLVPTYYVLQETPVQWKEAWGEFFQGDRSTRKSRSAPSAAGTVPAETSESRAEQGRELDFGVEESSTLSDENGSAGSSSGRLFDEGIAVPGNDVTGQQERTEVRREQLGSRTLPPQEREVLMDAIQLIDEGSVATAMERLNSAVAANEIRSSSTLTLLEIEAAYRQASGSRDEIWQKLMSLDPERLPELSQLCLTRWLLSSTRSERAEILLSTDTTNNNLAKRAVLWAEARGGSTDPATIKSLKSFIEGSSFSICDRIFLASVYFTNDKEDAAYELLLEVKNELRELRLDNSSPVEAWLREAFVESLSSILDGSIAKLGNSIGFPVSTSAD